MQRKRPRIRDAEITEADKPLIEKLRPEHREIIAMSGTYLEISGLLKIPLGTVRSRLHRAREHLAKLRMPPEQ